MQLDMEASSIMPVQEWPDPYDPIDSLESPVRSERTVFILTTFHLVPIEQYKERQEGLISKLQVFYHVYGIRTKFNFLRIDPSDYESVTFSDRVRRFAQMIDTSDVVVIDADLTIKFNYDLRILIMYIHKKGISYIWLDTKTFIIWAGHMKDFEFRSKEDELPVQEYIINTKEVTEEELYEYERETKEEW